MVREQVQPRRCRAVGSSWTKAPATEPFSLYRICSAISSIPGLALPTSFEHQVRKTIRHCLKCGEFVEDRTSSGETVYKYSGTIMTASSSSASSMLPEPTPTLAPTPRSAPTSSRHKRKASQSTIDDTTHDSKRRLVGAVTSSTSSTSTIEYAHQLLVGAPHPLDTDWMSLIPSYSMEPCYLIALPTELLVEILRLLPAKCLLVHIPLVRSYPMLVMVVTSTSPRRSGRCARGFTTLYRAAMYGATLQLRSPRLHLFSKTTASAYSSHSPFDHQQLTLSIRSTLVRRLLAIAW